jgi:hypothetical protein
MPALVGTDGRLWRTGPAVADNRTMPQRRLRLAASENATAAKQSASIPLEHIRRPRDTPIWKLAAALKCRSCRTPRRSPPVHMIKLTMEREIAPT